MKKEPTSNTNKWVHKIFFPRLLVTAIWRYAFPNSNRLKSSTAAKITHGLSIGYVLATSTIFGIVFYKWKHSEETVLKNDPNAILYAKLWTSISDAEDPNKKITRYKVGLTSIQKEDITDQVREHHLGGPVDQDYDKYTNPDYIRKRLNISKGSTADENMDMEVAAMYLRRIDEKNRLK